jgi:predicted short-subunit dehydrogenase-like oxidoreductase (DUF2520 family)
MASTGARRRVRLRRPAPGLYDLSGCGEQGSPTNRCIKRMKRPLRLSIIGAGRVGQSLGRLGREVGYEIADIVCRSRRSALTARRFIGAGTPLTASSKQLQAVNVTLIATPDDRIGEAVQLILNNSRRIGRGVVLHTSGALSSAALAALREANFAVGSCHPLQTFECPLRAITVIPQSYFCIEGDSQAVRAARRFVRCVGAQSFEIPTTMKSLYHAAAVMASGGVTTLLSTSLDVLQHCGLNEAQARRVLLPLTETTVANVRAVGPLRAFTGPVRRGDIGTVQRNLEALAAIDRQWLAVYQLLAAHSLRLIESQLDRAIVDRLQRLLTASGH